MKLTKDRGFITHLDIAAEEVEKIRLLYGKKKTVSDWYRELGADVVINGALYNGNGIPIEQYKTDGTVLSESDWCRDGFGVCEDQRTVIFGEFTKWFLDFTSAFPMLIKNGEKHAYVGAESIAGKHPRTVFSQVNGGYRITLVDGRQNGKPGMDLPELATYLKEMGDVFHAANLDGGGSTCGVVNGQMVNTPSEQRKVSNVLAIWLKKTLGEDEMVKTYSLKPDGTKSLSANFKVREFRCHDGSDSICIDSDLVKVLQQIRDHFGQPVTITSAYRNESYNRKVGGASGSYHVKGRAADITVKNTAPKEVAAYAEQIGVKGIGLYESNTDGYFVHVDTRDKKSFWYGQAQSYRETFGGGSDAYTEMAEELGNYISISDPAGLAEELRQYPDGRLYWICKKILEVLRGNG